jgi:hypothetical protein
MSLKLPDNFSSLVFAFLLCSQVAAALEVQHCERSVSQPKDEAERISEINKDTRGLWRMLKLEKTYKSPELMTGPGASVARISAVGLSGRAVMIQALNVSSITLDDKTIAEPAKIVQDARLKFQRFVAGFNARSLPSPSAALDELWLGDFGERTPP